MPIEAIEFDTEKSEQDKLLAEATEALATYTEVRDMVQLPGWGRFITELHRRAKKAREEYDDALDATLAERTKETETQYKEAKIRLFALEEAIQLYVKIRERAQLAKELLDRMPQDQADSPKNG